MLAAPVSDWLRADAVSQAAGADALAVEVVASVGSTNEVLLSRPIGDSAAGARLMVAREQTAGRGRRGRTWFSDPDHCLTFSIALERPARADDRPLAGFSLAVGVALAEALSSHVPGLRVKWPNDLQRDGRKCAGILVETRRLGPVERVVIGIGLNLRAPERHAADIGQPAGGLFDGSDVPDRPLRERLLADVAAAQLQMWSAFRQRGLSAFLERWARFDALHGHEIAILDGGRTLMAGRAAGIDDGGALRVQTPNGVMLASVGEVSARRIAT